LFGAVIVLQSQLRQHTGITVARELFQQQYKSNNMPLLTILIVIIAVGVLLWLINNYIPMDRKIKSILNVVVVIVLVIWLLQAFGILSSLKSIRV
jgi:predicted lysophospholipase L1 biosynthesis ABC-type transport system permease subunit